MRISVIENQLYSLIICVILESQQYYSWWSVFSPEYVHKMVDCVD